VCAAWQVLCSSHCWDAASEPSSKLEGIAAVNAGLYKMKGIQSSVHLYSCTYLHSCAAGARAARLCAAAHVVWRVDTWPPPLAVHVKLS
jgi:hypothetical protein